MTGADIDKYPVVQMWNHDWQSADRYGSRYDYGLATTLRDARDASRRPTKAWLFYNVPHEKAVQTINGDPVIFLDHMSWYKKAALHGARSFCNRALKFTRGFAAVAGVIQCLKPKRIIVIGMDVLCNGVTGVRYFDADALPFYVESYPQLAQNLPLWASNEFPSGLRGDGPHDFSAEAAVIRELAAEVGTKLVWE
jgi:hypothetical protein